MTSTPAPRSAADADGLMAFEWADGMPEIQARRRARCSHPARRQALVGINSPDTLASGPTVRTSYTYYSRLFKIRSKV